jgi:hypothetical protein
VRASDAFDAKCIDWILLQLICLLTHAGLEKVSRHETKMTRPRPQPMRPRPRPRPQPTRPRPRPRPQFFGLETETMSRDLTSLLGSLMHYINIFVYL